MSVEVGLPPPSTTTPTGGGGSRWVRLCGTANDIEAHLVVGRLAEAGVESRTIRDRSGPGAWLYGGMNPWAPVVVYVRSFQLDDARLALAEAALVAPAANRSAPPPRSRLALKWWATALALGLVLSGVALAQVAAAVRACRVPVICDGGTP